MPELLEIAWARIGQKHVEGLFQADCDTDSI